MRILMLGVAALTAGCPNPPAVAPAGSDAPRPQTEVQSASPRFLKGQLHCHSDASGDSNTPAAEVAQWYWAHDFDFIVLTDHNRITDIPSVGEMLVLPGIELTQNLPECVPAPEPGMQCLLHVNALVVDPSKAAAVAELPRPQSLDRVDLYTHAVRVSEQIGGVAMLNHPNFHYAADARVIGTVARQGLQLLEIANEAIDSNNGGDPSHPNTERLWDDVLASGARVWGTATDDAHHYDDAEAVRASGQLAFEGNRGWVMVRAERNPAAIRDALGRGDFYASTGVTIEDIVTDGTRLRIELPATATDHEIRFVGSDGATLERQTGVRASFDLARSDSRYVRAVVGDATGHMAWTQPVFRAEGSAG